MYQAHRIIHQVCGKLYDLMAIKVGQRERTIAEMREKMRDMSMEFEDKVENMKKSHERSILRRKEELERE